MKPRLTALVVTAAFAVLVGGCKKPEADVTTEAESTLPKEEQMPTPTAAGKPDSAYVADDPKVNQEYEAWFKKYKLDLNNPRMLDEDPDGDGATNREEFLADTDPTDSNSRPGIHKSLRLKEYNEARVPFLVRDITSDSAVVEFTGDGSAAPVREKVRKGETVRGTKLKVEGIQIRADTDKHGDKVDLSQLIMTDGETSERIVALKDLPTRTSASYAELVSLDGKSTVKVREGETFSWPGEPGVSYKVIDLRQDQIVVKDETSGQTVTIPRQ